MTNNFIKIGKILNPYSILGWMHVQSFTNIDIDIFNYTPWFIANNNQLHSINSIIGKKKQNKLLVKFISINTRNQAKLLNNSTILIKEKQLPNLLPYEYYWKDIINCEVYHTYQKLGLVTKIINTGANDILFVENKKSRNKKEILIPFIMNHVIKKINLDAKVITVEWPM
ncbi:MAG: ribosome maturation factor RimM [Buchnera aphidicola (Eriosoma harunire)]